MVSKANEDLPDPERPVITMSLSRGRTRSRFLRLCSRAPLMMMERESGIVVHCNRRNRTSQAPLVILSAAKDLPLPCEGEGEGEGDSSVHPEPVLSKSKD